MKSLLGYSFVKVLVRVYTGVLNFAPGLEGCDTSQYLGDELIAG